MTTGGDGGDGERPAIELLAQAVVAAFEGGLVDLDAARLVREALPPLPPKRAKVRIVAAGKAALRMTQGAFDLWGDRIADALVVTPVPEGASTPRTLVRVAAHPRPDPRSVAAADEALTRAASLGTSDLLLALISGGASSLLCAPPPSLGLEGKVRAIDALIDAGAPIRDVNLVRRHLSRIKGGGLALAAARARVLTLIVSDVIGGAPHDVGSGPSVPDPTSPTDAERVVARWAPSLGTLPFTSGLAEGTAGSRTRARIVAEPSALAERVAARLAAGGFAARALAAEEGEARDVVSRRASQARSLAPGEAIAIACEPTVRLPASRGSGGRAGFVALALLHDLPPGVVFLAAASDGADGASGSGGALVTADDATRVSRADATAALARFDDGPVHRALGTALPGRPTGHNLTDLHVLARAPSA